MIDLELWVVAAGLAAGVVVGLTGMGGGALLTPLLVLGLGVPPVTAVSSDVVASVGMKFVGASVHMKHGTVHRGVATWLMIGSIPAAVLGAYLLRQLADAGLATQWLLPVLGGVLLVAATAMAARALLKRSQRNAPNSISPRPPVRPIPTLLVGVLGGLVVGLTSVGSGSLMLVLVMLLYPALSASRLIGTDLTQALPLVTAAAIAHMFFGSVDWGLTAAILIGGIPGIYLGARYSSRAPDHVIRPLLVILLTMLGLKLLKVPFVVIAAAVVVAVVAWGGYALWRQRARRVSTGR